MQLRDWSLLLLLSAMWGGSFLFMRVAAPVLGAVPLIALRVSIAAVLLCGFGLAARRFARPAPPWRPLAVVGVLNSALPFALFADALKHIPASLAAPLNATTPLFSAAVAAAWLGEPFTARRALGLILGIAGAALLVGAGPVAVTPLTVRAAASCLVAAGCYGFAAVYTRRHLSGVPSFDTAAYSQFAAAAALLPLVPGTWPRAALTPQVLGAVLALGVVCTALAYLLYFHLIARVGAVRATTVTYLAPAFGVIWGVLLLGETINAATVAGFALILVSAALVNRSAPAGVREHFDVSRQGSPPGKRSPGDREERQNARPEEDGDAHEQKPPVLPNESQQVRPRREGFHNLPPPKTDGSFGRVWRSSSRSDVPGRGRREEERAAGE